MEVTFAHARSKEVGCVIVAKYSPGPAVVSSEAMRPCSSVGVAARGSHMLSYAASISSSRLWSPSEVFASVMLTILKRVAIK